MVIIKSHEQIEGIRKSCHLLAEIMEELVGMVRPGVTTKELNTHVEKRILEAGAIPAFKGYTGGMGIPFPTALCASKNEVIVHGPSTSEEPLKDGDIIGLDLGVKLGGYYSDMAVSVPVGKIDSKTKQLLDVTKKSLYNGIEEMKPGNTIRDISKAIEVTIKPHGYGIVREFVGHGVGVDVHEDPRIPNFVSETMREDLMIKLKPGMILALEPMVTMGKHRVNILDDGWSAVTADASISAHFEHTVLITEDGYEILTKKQ